MKNSWWHEVICCKIGVDRTYISHLILHPMHICIATIAELSCRYVEKTPGFWIKLSMNVLTIMSYLCWALPAHMLYINTFRYTVMTFKIDPNHLYKRMLKMLTIVQFLHIPSVVIILLSTKENDYIIPAMTFHKVLIFPLISFAMYMGLDGSTWRISYIFSTKRFPKEIIFVLVGTAITVIAFLCVSTPDWSTFWRSCIYTLERIVIIATHSYLWCTGLEMIRRYEFECLDAYDSDLEDDSIKKNESTSAYLSFASGPWRIRGLSDFEPDE